MSRESNKLLAQWVWEEVWHQGQLSRIDDLFTMDFVRHDPGGRELQGTEQNRQFIGSLRAAFPDVHYTVEDQIAEGDKVVVRYRILVYRIGDGKIAEQWTEFDLLGFLRQLGVLPNS